MKQKIAFHYILTSFFLLLIWTPFLQMQSHIFPEMQSTEKRLRHPLPILSLQNPHDFPIKYEQYFNEAFGFRNNLISNYNLLLIALFSHPQMGDVLFGKHGWLFYTVGMNQLPYSREELNSILNSALVENQYLKSKGILFILAVAPNKQTIYPEYLQNLPKDWQESQRLARRHEYLHTNTDIIDIDLRQPLLNKKDEFMLYYKTDTHWNNYGSFVAYQNIINEIKHKYPNIEPLALSDFNIRSDQTTGKDLAMALSVPYYYEDTEITFTLKNESRYAKLNKEKQIPKLLLYYDSFFDPKHSWGTGRFLSHHFQKVILQPYYKAYDHKLIDRENPDIVIYAIAERNI